MALVFRGCRYDLSICDDFLPGLGASLLRELGIIQRFVADNVSGTYFRVEYLRIARILVPVLKKVA
jgi:hypothetical protein